ncbi:MAG: transporter substrate-binding domain-containing protein [Lachnospiraceae bacterium]|nr:transporter substrate-binding domain-containing protein [Lachnospiraceae bacterium]MBP3505552.1 transporter substrate-binding domain-containing protein [Lachnospiraceae bacterium]
MKKLASKITAAGLIVAVAFTAVGCNASTNAGSVVKTIDISLTDEQYAFGVDKNNAELLEQTNAYIAQVKEDGTLDEICDKYFGDGTPEGITSAKQDDSKEQLVVATNAEFSPFEYKEGDTFYGIDMELAAGLAEYLDMELVILDVDFEAVCTYVDTGKADMAIAGLTINETRKESVNFTDSYYTASQLLIVPSENTDFDACETAEDVLAVIAEQENGRIGGQSGTTAEYFVKGDADWGFDGISNMSWVGYTSGSLAVNDMLSGNINYVIIDEAPANMIVKKVNAAN